MDESFSRLIEKVDKLYDLAVQVKETTAVHEQKWREINSKLESGRQANISSQDLLRDKLERIESLMETKVDIEDYKVAFNEMKEMLSMDRKMIEKNGKMWMLVVIITLVANGVASNIDFIKYAIQIWIQE